MPPVKRAVHHLTAPRHAPKVVRRIAAKAPAQPQQVAAPRLADCDPGLGGAGPVVPLVTYAAPIPEEPTQGLLGGGLAGGVPVVGAIGVVPGGGGTVTPPVVTPVDPGPGPVPEPSVWLMMIAGVGTLGAALRRRRSTALAGHGASRRTAMGGLLWSGSAAVEAGDMAATVAMKSVVASAAGKAMLCVCPAAIVAGSVMTVPPLRQAVHAATIPPEPSVPLVAAAPIVALPPCDEVTTVPVAATAIEGFPAAVSTTPVTASAEALVPPNSVAPAPAAAVASAPAPVAASAT